MQIASITTNEQGEYEYATEEDYLEQTLDFVIQKEGFERKNISYEIDKAEIKSDILLNELEKGTKEKTRIFGTIRNSKNRDPVKAASITLSIEGTQIATMTSDELGGYEYTAEEDFVGQTLDFIIQKEGFIRQDISHEIERFEIESDFLMDEIEIKIKGKICDETDNPLDNASIIFSIGNSTINRNTDKDGLFSFDISEQYLNKSIDYTANKTGFQTKTEKIQLKEGVQLEIKLIAETEESIEPKISVKDKKKNPLEGVKLSLDLGGEQVGIGISDKNGIVKITLKPEFKDKTIQYKAELGGFEIASGEIKVTEELSQEIKLKPLRELSFLEKLIVTAKENPIAILIITGIVATALLALPGLLNDHPEINDYWADPYIINPGESSRLHWSVSNAADVIIHPEIGSVGLSGSVEIHPTRTTTYALTIINENGEEVDSVEVVVEVLEEVIPEINYFEADPEHIDGLEGETTLSWEVSGATTVTIDGVGPVEVSEGSIDRWVEQTTTFILRATNDAGVPDVRTTRVYVEGENLNEPVIHYFIANPDIISSGEKSTLQWDVSGVETVTINNKIGKMGGIGNTDVYLDETTVFVLTAENAAGKDAKTLTVLVEKPELTLDPESPNFDFGIMDKGGTDSRTFSISNTGGGTLEWEISTIQNWISVYPTKGSNSEEVKVTVETVDLDAGSHGGEITIKSNGGNIDIPVSLVIKQSIPAAPSKLTNIISSRYCAIEWIDNSENEDGFNIYIGDSGCGSCEEGIYEWEINEKVDKDVTGFSWSESCCDVAECSCVMVRAYNEIGESSNSNIIMLAPLC